MATASMVGAVLGSYRITGELSSGGMGTVYRAEHELLGRSAAIKLLRPELTENADLVQRFFNEAKAATAIKHPGIIEVYDFGYTEHGQAYVVMELLDGEPLGARLRRRGRLAEVEAVTIAKGIASALKAAHGKGIVHRDLKPDNVFLVPDPDGTGDRVKVLDFGVAKLEDPARPRHTMTGALLGTPLYMAPEQARAAGTIDHRADLYSVGCMLYELLVGQPPFVAEGAGEIIAMQMFSEPQPPSQRGVALSPELEACVMRLLAKEPHDRYGSAAELFTVLADLGTRSASAPVIAPRSIAAPTVTVAARRSTMPLIAGVITVLIAAVVVGVVVMRGSSAPERAAPTVATPAAVVVTPPAPPVRAPATVPAAKIDVDPDIRVEDQPKVNAPVPVTTSKPSDRLTHPVAHPATHPVAHPATHPAVGPVTDQGSPYNLDLGPAKPPTTP